MEHDAIQFSAAFRKFAEELAIQVDDSCLPLFFSYLSELKKWNRAINLTAIEDEQEVLVKHFIDSIAGMKVIENIEIKELLDVGAGAGFPGIPLKLMLPQIELELLEPSEKKGSFLRYVAGALGLKHVTVIPSKLEHYVGRPHRRLFDCIVVRAFKVDESGQLLADILKSNGKVILYRAERVAKGFSMGGLALVEEVEYELPSGYGHRVLSVFSK